MDSIEEIEESTILHPLNSVQKNAVKTTEGPLLILAGAGTGKTRTIVHRISYMVHVQHIPPEKIIAVTFTNKAVEELKERIAESAGIYTAHKMIISTFHSLGFLFLRNYFQYLDYQNNFVIWDTNDQKICIQPILKDILKDKLNNVIISYFINTISAFKDNLISYENLKEKIDIDNYEYGDILPEIYKQYEIRKTSSNAFDFGDLLYKAVKLLQNHNNVLEELHNRYSYFLIDEYQDTNYAQYMLVNILAKKENNLCVVGDDDQSIYSWRGADIRNILEFEKDYPNSTVMKLEENYRSHDKILKISNSVIQNNQLRKEKTLFSNISHGAIPQLFVFHDDRDEANFVVSQILSLQTQQDAKEIAILYRTNIQSQPIEKALLKNNIPYQIFGGISFFDRKEIKDVFAYLNFLINPNDNVSFLRIINTPNRGVGSVSVDKIYKWKEQNAMLNPSYSFLNALTDINQISINNKAKESIRSMLHWFLPLIKKQNNIDPHIILEITNTILEKSKLLESYQQEDNLLGTNRIEHIEELKNNMVQFIEENPGGSLMDFLTEHTINKKVYPNDLTVPKENLISLMSIHNAKGLEFSTVFLLGLDDDILPHYLCKKTIEQIEEERRLFYVAITRAKKNLYLTRCNNRFKKGYIKQTKESPFLIEIPEHYLQTNKVFNPYSNQQQIFTKKYRKFSYKNTIAAQDIQNIPKTIPNFQKNDIVKHSKFGIGTIQKLEGENDNTIAHVQFPNNGVKKLLVKFSKLEKVLTK